MSKKVLKENQNGLKFASDFKKFENIQEFYQLTGMNKYQALNFFINELTKILKESEGKKNEKKSLEKISITENRPASDANLDVSIIESKVDRFYCNLKEKEDAKTCTQYNSTYDNVEAEVDSFLSFAHRKREAKKNGFNK
jgi:hypothetical protein